MKSLGIALITVALLAGCTTPPATGNEAPAIDPGTPAVDPMAPFTLELKGNVVVGALDIKNHDQPTEQVIFPLQKAGWNIKIDETPKAIEVRVDWEGAGSFMLHPHYYIGDDSNGVTQYYGYHSPRFTDGTGCIRLTDADLQPGVWPMMVHPGADTRDVEFTITVGILGAQANVLPEMHGHRADGNYVITEHEVSECQFLGAL